MPATSDIFTPTRPVGNGQRLIGRDYELTRILQALMDEDAHVVLYSERGRGKTSLINRVVHALRARGTIVARHTCEASSTFDTVMRGLARDLPRGVLAVRARRDPDAGGSESAVAGCEAALPTGPLRPSDIVALPTRLRVPEIVFVVDEFDRIEDVRTRTQIADTIKQLSDRSVKLFFMVIGVSDSLDQLLGQHPSIQRALVAVQLPLLSETGVTSLVADGLRQAGITLLPPLLGCVVTLSLGMPYMAQLLGLRLLQTVRSRGGDNVTTADLSVALSRIVAEANPRIMGLLASLTDHGRDRPMAVALHRVALSRQDAYGRIEAEPRPDGVRLGEHVIAAASWERLREAGVIRACTDESQGRISRWYSFGERGLIHHVLLKAVIDGGPPGEPAIVAPSSASRVVEAEEVVI